MSATTRSNCFRGSASSVTSESPLLGCFRGSVGRNIHRRFRRVARGVGTECPLELGALYGFLCEQQLDQVVERSAVLGDDRLGVLVGGREDLSRLLFDRVDRQIADA